MTEPTPPPPSESAPTLAAAARPELRWSLLAVTALLGAVVGLRAMGRRWWCACGLFNPWTGEARGQHTSQHLVDPYSFTHVLHGFALYALLWLARRWLAPRARLALAVALESLWELVENSSWVIEKYRTATLALAYYGDTVWNSLGDMGCCTLGFLLARRLPVKVSIALFVAVELALLVTIRDSLTVNVILLAFPIESLKAWQAGG